MKKNGFTLIELMTAMSIFIVVMTVSVGSLINVFDANRKSRSLKTVINNLNLSVESMSREIRFGKNYHCGSTGTLTQPQDCPSGDNFISFLSSDDVQITYQLNGQAIEKQVDGEGYVAITAPEIVIDSLNFYALGTGTTGANSTLQPKVLMKIQSHAGTGKSRSDFTLQTMVSQRPLDI